MTECGKFWTAIETRILVDMESQDNIQKMLLGV